MQKYVNNVAPTLVSERDSVCSKACLQFSKYCTSSLPVPISAGNQIGNNGAFQHLYTAHWDQDVPLARVNAQRWSFPRWPLRLSHAVRLEYAECGPA